TTAAQSNSAAMASVSRGGRPVTMTTRTPASVAEVRARRDRSVTALLLSRRVPSRSMAMTRGRDMAALWPGEITTPDRGSCPLPASDTRWRSGTTTTTGVKVVAWLLTVSTEISGNADSPETGPKPVWDIGPWRSEEHTSELQSRFDVVC